LITEIITGSVIGSTACWCISGIEPTPADPWRPAGVDHGHTNFVVLTDGYVSAQGVIFMFSPSLLRMTSTEKIAPCGGADSIAGESLPNSRAKPLPID
jgi:hypothetical protein